MTQKDKIRSMGKDLGFGHNLEGATEADQLKSIAKSVGMDNYNSSNSADNNELERRLKEREKDQGRRAANDAKRNRTKNIATAAGNKIAGPAGGYIAGKLADAHMKRKNANDDMMHDMLEKNRQRQYDRNRGKSGGEQEGSSSSGSKQNENSKTENGSQKESGSKKPSNLLPNFGNNKKDGPLEEIKAKVKRIKMIIIAAGVILGALLIVIVIIAVISSVLGILDDNNDQLGFSSSTGRSTGNITYTATSKEQREFYERINDVELDFLAKGQQIDALKIVAVYQVLKTNGAKIDYDSMSESDIRDIANAMLNGGIYDEETFKNNLKNDIFPKYLPSSSQKSREVMADSVIKKDSDYYAFIGEEPVNIYAGCAGPSTCSYDIKGYYIKSKGNVTENIQVSNLYVRLMQCGTANGHNYGGTFGKPLEGESLIPFETYILGVAYQEIGPDSPAEAIKAQMVAARSYILARHADMGGWRTLKQESNQWVLQAAACTQDQVFCNPDKGCSGTNGQWGQIYSGTSHNKGFSRQPLSQTSPLRTYLNQTSGEVLTNDKGYIIYSGYTQTEQNKMISLAKQGLTYKQILLQVYNQGNRNYGATDVKKASCTAGAMTNCGSASFGAFANWKQAGQPWSNVKMGNSGRTIGQIGCLVTSVAMLIAKSGVQTSVANFNPGTFVQFLNNNGGFDGDGNLSYAPISKAAPSFRWVNQIDLRGMSREQKLNTIRNYQSQGYFMAAEVSTSGQHWVAIDTVNGNSIKVMDPATNITDLWGSGKYTPQSTKTLNLFKVG